MAQYRAGYWGAAVEALNRSMELCGRRRPRRWFFLAMAHRQLGDAAEARRWYDKADAWMEAKGSRDEELRRFRAEAAALLEADDLSCAEKP